METVRDVHPYTVFDDNPEGNAAMEEWEREQERAVQLLSVYFVG